MALNFLVTAAAIAGFLKEAQNAQDDLKKAMDNCDRAAENLMAHWQGPAAEAFRKEEESFKLWGRSMDSKSREVLGTVSKVLDSYVQADTN